MKVRRAKSHTKILNTDVNITIRGTGDITEEIVGFYRNLLGTSAPRLLSIHPTEIKMDQRLPALNNYNLYKLLKLIMYYRLLRE